MKQATMPWHYNEGEERAQNWRSPEWLFAEATSRYTGAQGYALDVCAEPWNAQAPYFFDESIDALSRDWTLSAPVRRSSEHQPPPLGIRRDHCVWCNPPYDNIGAWLRWAVTRLDAGDFRLVTFCIPSRTDRLWFHEIVRPRAWCIDFVDGRVHFEPPPGEEASQPFESTMLVTFQHRIVSRKGGSR